MEKLYRWQIEKDGYIRGALFLLKLVVLIGIFITLKPDIDAYRYFKSEYSTSPQVFTVVGFDKVLFDMGILPYGLRQLKESNPEDYRLWNLYYTNAKFRRDNELALQAVDKIKSLMGWFVVFYVLLFFLDLTLHNWAKSRLGLGSFKELWINGLRRATYTDGTFKKSVEDLKAVGTDVKGFLFDGSSKDEEVHKTAEDQDNTRDNFGKS